MALDNFRKTSMRIDKANQRFLDYQNAKAGDINGRELLVQITNNGVVEDQTGTTLKLNWQHENGNQGYANFKAVDIKTGKYSLYYPKEMLYKGTVDASIEINSNGQITHTMNFKIIVHGDVFNGEAGTVNGVFISLADVNKKLDDREKEYVELKSRQTSVETQFNSIQQEITDKDVISAPEIITARNGKANLKTRLDEEYQEVTAQLAQNSSYYWKPDNQPAARKDITGYFTDAFNLTAPEFIANHFEPLRLANTDYITRKSMGKDESGQYDVWRYVFEPVNYKKTIIISTCLHGGEVTPMVAMLRFLHYLVNEGNKIPQLAYIRENVRIVYTPFANPWGVSQKPRTRYNFNGVDLNRNFSEGWEAYNSSDGAFGHDWKGTSPMSEKETRYFAQTMVDFPDAIAYFDFHNTGVTERDFYVVLPTGYPYETFNQLLAYFSKGMDNPEIRIEQEGKPNGCEYIWANYGIPSGHPEWCDTSFGERMYDSDEVTAATAWFSNIILEHIRYYDAKVEIIDKNVKNSLSNSALSNDSSGWERGGLSAPVMSNGVLQTTGVSGSNTPYLFGQLATSDLAAGDVIFAAVEVKVPENCTSIELNLRDTTLGVTDNFSTITNPTANSFIKLAGTVVSSGISSNTKLQIRFLFNTASDVLGKNFELSKPIVVGTDNRANPSDLKYAIDKNGFFSGNKTITYVNNVLSLDEPQKSILGYMISKD